MLKKVFFIVFACVLLILFIPRNAIKVDENLVKKFSVLSFFNTREQNRSNYLQALALENAKDYKKAYYAYNMVSCSYDAYAGALFHQAQCSEKLNDEKTAIRKYKQLIVECRDSKLLPVAHYRLAQIYMRQNKFSKAKKELMVLIKKYPDIKYATGAYYYLGIVEKEKNPQKSRDYFFEYLKKSPSGIFAKDCMDELDKYSSEFSKEENLYYGIGLYHQKSYKEAIDYLSKASIENSWYYKVKSYFSIDEKTLAFYTIENGIKNYSDMLSDDELQDMMSLYVRMDNRSAYDSWSYLASITSSKKGHDCALYNKAVRSSEADSLKIYEKISSQYPDGQYASESLWKVFFNYYMNSQYSKALKLANTHIDRYKNTKASPRILFWAAKIKEKQHKKGEASAYYRKIIMDYPDSYYAMRASGRKRALEGRGDFFWKSAYFENLDEDSFFENIKTSYSEINKKYGALVGELFVLKDYDTVLLVDDTDRVFKSLMSLSEGDYEKSCYYARTYLEDVSKKPDKSSFIWRLSYPIHYSSRINTSSRYHRLDPYLVIALMREESHFNPRAISAANAYGLMQILPGTANDVAKWNKIPPINPQILLDPDTNIRFSTTYLSFLKNKFNGNMIYAVASYNGGYGAVQRWISKSDYEDLDEFVEKIPYSETQNYVKKVFASYWNYRRLYNNVK